MDTRTAKAQLKKLLLLVAQEEIPIKRALVFGSHAKGLATRTSDLDVCLIFSDRVKLAPQLTAKLRYKLGRLNLNIDLSSLFESELRTNKLSCFINEVKKSSLDAEDFLRRAPKNLDSPGR